MTKQEKAEYQKNAQNQPNTPLTAAETARRERRQAYLARFRPEVREKMMTKQEKAERDQVLMDEAREKQRAAAAEKANRDNEASSTKPNNGTQPQNANIPAAAAVVAPTPPNNPINVPPQLNVISGSRIASPPPTAIGPIPGTQVTTVSQQNVAATPSSNEGQNQGGPSPSYNLTIDEASKKILADFNSSFGSYVDQLSKINIPSEIKMSHDGVVEVRVSGAEAFKALEEKMQETIDLAVQNKMEKIWHQSGGQLGDSPSIPTSRTSTLA